MDETWLPKLIKLEEFGGSWDNYLEAVYATFVADFINSKPTFFGKAVGLKRFPIDRGKEATFWHFVQEGSVEADRLPNFRRFERLPWIRPVIEAAGSRGDLRVWSQERRNSNRRIAIAFDDFSFLVIMDERQTKDGSVYHIPWTAYPVEQSHQQRKLENEWRRSGPCFVQTTTLKG